jgi:hypothetical protein
MSDAEGIKRMEREAAALGTVNAAGTICDIIGI